jgi:hypothetical protein
MQSIYKYSLKEPDVDLMILENASIEGNIISIDKKNIDKIFLPTMYESWFENIKEHIDFKVEENTSNSIENNDILYIFDTFGISSYYHLLIDTIIPLWITKNIIEEYLKKPLGKSYFLQISNNNYSKELPNANEIFKYFLNNNYTKNISGKFKYIVYGYCYRYRPYYGNTYVNRYYPKYQFMFDMFCDTFTKKEVEQRYILIPQRTTRSYEHIDKIYNELSKYYNVKMVDFYNYSIEEQIHLSSNAWAMIGCEGAAFANQIFMKKGSLIVCLGGNYVFQSSIAQYMDHTFYHEEIIDIEYEKIINKLLCILTPYEPYFYKGLV